MNDLEFYFGICSQGTPGGGFVAGVGGSLTVVETDTAPIFDESSITIEHTGSFGIPPHTFTDFRSTGAVGIHINDAGGLVIVGTGARGIVDGLVIVGAGAVGVIGGDRGRDGLTISPTRAVGFE